MWNTGSCELKAIRQSEKLGLGNYDYHSLQSHGMERLVLGAGGLPYRRRCACGPVCATPRSQQLANFKAHTNELEARACDLTASNSCVGTSMCYNGGSSECG